MIARIAGLFGVAACALTGQGYVAAQQTSWRSWLALALLTATSAVAVKAALSAALAGVVAPLAFTSGAFLVQAYAFGVTPPARSWVSLALLSAAMVLAALAAGQLEPQRLVEDRLALVTVVVAIAFVSWQFAGERDSPVSWRTAYPVAGLLHDVLMAVAVALPIVWGLALVQPERRHLLLGCSGLLGVYWSGYLTPEIPQRQFPWMLLAMVLLAITVLAAVRPDPQEQSQDWVEAES